MTYLKINDNVSKVYVYDFTTEPIVFPLLLTFNDWEEINKN